MLVKALVVMLGAHLRLWMHCVVVIACFVLVVVVTPTMKNKKKHDPKSEQIANLQSNQVFLGIAASRARPKPESIQFVEDLMGAGIRFVYFTRRNMRRCKSFAQTLGMDTEWNSCVSLADNMLFFLFFLI